MSERSRAERRGPGALVPLLAAALALSPAGVAAPPVVPTTTMADRTALNLATFDRVWSLVADTHWDADLGGVDWQGVRDQLRPRAAAAAGDRELRRVLEDMVGRLGQSHFAFLAGGSGHDGGGSEPGGDEDLLPGCAPHTSAQILRAIDTESPAAGDVGLELRRIAGSGVVVARVAPRSPAARAGIAPGWRLLAVDGQGIEARISCLDHVPDPSFRNQLLRSWLRSLLQGPAGSEVRLRFDTGPRRERELVARRERPAEPLVGFGNLPPMPFEFELSWVRARRGARVAVIRFNLWLFPAATAFEQATPELRDADAVVIDLRGNPGGVSAIAQGVAGHFVSDRISLGSLRGRRDQLEMTVQPRRVARDGSRVEPYAGPLAILIDGGSASTSELFAAGLRDHDRARLFGEPSAGAALPAVLDRLPNGDVFLHASMDYVRPNGERVEGRPIVPDVTTPLRRDELLAGKDAALGAALRWIAEGPNHQ